MIDKKKLIEELLDCVADATDTETQVTSLTVAGMLMSEVLDEVLTIPAVSKSLDEKIKVEDCEYYCSDECDCIGKYCGYGTAK